jgi:pimeloyl-ACP methyl ester carboxylesterase
MPQIELAPDLVMHYEDDDWADAWQPHDTVLLLHGFAESGRIWFAWVPHLARHYRVLRPDLRGLGRSTVPPDPARFSWSPTGFADDVARFLDAIGIDRVHVVGARLGGPIGVELAAHRPELVKSLSIVSGLARGDNVRGVSMVSDGSVVPFADFADNIRRRGVRGWFAETGRARLGSEAPEGQVSWWNDLMSESDPQVCAALIAAATGLDVYADLALVRAPTLVITGDRSAVQSLEVTKEWQRRIPNSELKVLSSDSPHLAATRPDECAELVLEFLEMTKRVSAPDRRTAS